ncbi:MAG: DeoR/GlpR family DNA-binding transcription regulator [Marinibacterium sp.]
MKPGDRQTKILDILNRDGEVWTDALASLFGVSVETIRRDLGSLAERGALHKVQGGARPIRLLSEGSFRERAVEMVAEKDEIARKLARIIDDGETLFMDTGTTTLACADALAERQGLKIITNSLHLALRLGAQSSGHRLFLIGGAYGCENAQTVGPLAIDQIESFQADRAILTVAAIDAGSGAMDANYDEAQIARAMIRNARSTVILAHSQKFGRQAAFRVCRPAQMDMLISDQAPDATLAAEFESAGVVLQ